LSFCTASLIIVCPTPAPCSVTGRDTFTRALHVNVPAGSVTVSAPASTHDCTLPDVPSELQFPVSAITSAVHMLAIIASLRPVASSNLADQKRGDAAKPGVAHS